MPITITGWLTDFRPLVRCRIAPGSQTGVAGEGIECNALIDTGATDCHIRPSTQQALGLPVTETAFTANIGTSGVMPVTRIDVRIAGVNESGQAQLFASTNARAYIDEFDGSVDMIIGMNVLRLLRELRIERGVPVLIADN